MAKVIKCHLLKRPKKLHGGQQVWYWVLRWSSTTGGYRYRSLGRTTKMTRNRANAARDQMLADLTGGITPRDRPSEMTISEYLEFHEQQFGHAVRPTTIIGWRSVRKVLIESLENKPITEITWSDFAVIRDSMSERGLHQSTICVQLSLIKTIIKRAADKGLIPANPFVNETPGAVPDRPIRAYTEREVAAMIDVAPDTFWQTIIRLAFTSGLRRGELTHLQWSNLLNNNTEVRVQEQHQRSHVTPSGVEIQLLPWKPKSKDSTRTVPLPAETTLALLRHRACSDESPYLFIPIKRLLMVQRRADQKYYGPKDGRTLGMTEPKDFFGGKFNKGFRAIQEKAKMELGDVNYQFGNFHDLRGSFATRAAASGVPLHELAKFMGHSDSKTCERYYLGIEDSAADRLRQAFSSQVGVG